VIINTVFQIYQILPDATVTVAHGG